MQRYGPSQSGDDAKLKERESTPGAALTSHRAAKEIQHVALWESIYNWCWK